MRGWSAIDTRFESLPIQEVQSYALSGACPCCEGTRLSKVVGAIIVCKDCGVAFHTAGD